MSGKTNISLGKEASFAKNLIKSVLKNSMKSQHGDKMSMKEYLASLSDKQKKQFNPMLFTPAKYAPGTTSAADNVNHLNSQEQIATNQSYVDAAVAKENKGIVAKNRAEGTSIPPVPKQKILNIEAVIPNSELLKTYPAMKDKLVKSGYRYMSMLETASTVILTTVSVDKDGKPIMYPKLDGEGKPVMGEDGKPIVAPKTDVRFTTYTPAGYSGLSEDDAVASQSVAAHEVILEALNDQAEEYVRDVKKSLGKVAELLGQKYIDQAAATGGQVSVNPTVEATKEGNAHVIKLTLDISGTMDPSKINKPGPQIH